MIPVAGKPVAAHQVELLRELGFESIVIVAGRMGEQLVNFFGRSGTSSDGCRVTVVRERGGPQGTAFSLAAAAADVGREPFLVLYGDTLPDPDDVRRLTERFEAQDGPAAVLVSSLEARNEASGDWICCRLHGDGGRLEVGDIVGHPRDGCTHRFAAFAFAPSFLEYVSLNSGLFTNVQVGMMPPPEGHLEMSLADWLADGGSVPAVEAAGPCWDLDKPWHILQANEWLVEKRCGELKGHELAEGASIDETAVVNGFVRLGPGSRIGRNVRIDGNAIVGAGTVIENGALLQGSHVIGNGVSISNYCLLSKGSTVGDRCVINHCAELDGILFDNVYLYHYMEFYGIVGASADLGAATVCGTLRFDDGRTTHRINGRRETPRDHANAVYLGDYARTGVNAILMPGVKVGVYSIVGPGVLLQEDLPNRKLVSLKQEHSFRDWGPERYGW
jgi:bifunctional UDP-N-acetylglucosamine pyrophosphorylase/glucosamine-1-phosphate N-acetyltransferase